MVLERFENFQEGYAINNKVKIHYEIHGSGSRHLCLLSGLGLPGRSWYYLLRKFLAKEEYSILIIDNRGVGHSDIPIRLYYSVKGMAKDAIAVLEKVGWTGDIHLVGHNLGGMIAQWMVALKPNYFASVTLDSTSAGRYFPPTMRFMFGVPLAGLALTYKTRASRVVRLFFAKEFLSTSSDDLQFTTKREELNKFYLDIYNTSGKQSLIGNIQQMLGIFLHYLPKKQSKHIVEQKIPVLVLVGNKDVLVQNWYGELLARRLRGRLQIFKGCGHMIHQVHLDRYVEELAAHFTKAESRNVLSDN
ncbi:uncharacterized protein VTP21DRAFT_7169 [Calcarisporiella thermophila]|uniref:uncharacterized protein n=1 Tax=Calcarisporiella thermophila TaxID=911321 RepID=UPI0037440BC0